MRINHSSGGILIVDNYDSFTHNIRDAFGKLNADSTVVRNDEISEKDLEKLSPSHIVIGPGPGNPHNPEEIGITPQAIDFAMRNQRVLLGICLGHQALAAHFGGKVVPAPEILHGKRSLVLDLSSKKTSHPSIFEGINLDKCMRYHSLCVDLMNFPNELEITSTTAEPPLVIMGLQHKRHKLYGLQFHPESFATDGGLQMLENFLKIHPGAHTPLNAKTFSFPDSSKKIDLPFGLRQRLAICEQRPYEQHEFPCELPPEEVYARLHRSSDHAFCFESLEEGSGSDKHSYFGFEPAFVLGANNETLLIDGEKRPTRSAPFDVLAKTQEILQKDATGDVPEGQHFSGGLVGFMGYEAAQYLEPSQFLGRTPKDENTFAFGYFDDGIVYDRTHKKYFYFTRGRNRFELFQSVLERPAEEPSPVLTLEDEGISREEFMKRVAQIQNEEIRTGNSFQTVLSNRKTFRIKGSMAPLYARLRSICPSAYMHAIKMGDAESMGSMPELILSIAGAEAEMTHLAGTAKRTGHAYDDAQAFAKLITDPKEIAEHMMLVDLARNDAARIAELGTVTLPEELLMHRRDAGPVMHIASEIRAKLRKDISPLRALLIITPMGTVSGAPKIRSMQIIYRHEDGKPRGLYASSIGFCDVRGNLKAVVGLRSIMRQKDRVTIQSGAGIVMDSDPASEFEETEKKKIVTSKTIEPFLRKDNFPIEL